MFITRRSGKRLHIFASTPPTTSYASGHLANDKYATYQLLSTTGIPQPESVLADALNTKEAILLLTKYSKVVVKPLDSGHGLGITTDITSRDQLESAIDIALQNNNFADKVIVQQQFSASNPVDLRLLCIDGKFLGAIHRIPAQVKADGLHNVKELIDIENSSGKRGKPYFSSLAYIDTERAHKFLQTDMEKIYPAETYVPVMSVANYGAGGEIHDVTDDIPYWMVQIAENVANISQLAVCGVDIMTDVMPQSSRKPNEIESVVIEVNKAPSLVIHECPSSGRPRPAIKSYVDYLEQLP